MTGSPSAVVPVLGVLQQLHIWLCVAATAGSVDLYDDVDNAVVCIVRWSVEGLVQSL